MPQIFVLIIVLEFYRKIAWPKVVLLVIDTILLAFRKSNKGNSEDPKKLYLITGKMNCTRRCFQILFVGW